MVQLIDTHSHLYDEAFDEDIDIVINNALEKGVTKIILPAIDSSTIERQKKLSASYPDIFYQMIGVHPTSIKEDYRKELDVVYNEISTNADSYLAIGEVGLDYYWDTTFAHEQQTALITQIEWANKYQKPVALHVRNAYTEMFEVLEKHSVDRRGVLHCFSGTLSDAKRAVDMGYMLGIGGVVTFKKNELAKIVAELPLQNILLETDAPYLAPTPYRGKRNESAYVLNVAQIVAEIKNTSLEQVAETTLQNAVELFGI
ncbi:MAG: TatD family hydrolase [Bacteroidales bacterium]|nr:TatD family hydrolase [Bacteroidales bacterium]